MTTSRLEAFSDGVLAIAITLLVLELKVPRVTHGRLLHVLASLWPSYASYAVSFLVIGIIWVNHHVMFDRVATVDRNLLFLNIGLLMGVAFLPFPTALLAAYARDSSSDSHVAAAIYSTTMLAIGLAFVALWTYLARRPALLQPGFTPEMARAARRRTLVGPAVYALSIVVAFVSATACLVVYAAMAGYFMLPGRPARVPAVAA